MKFRVSFFAFVFFCTCKSIVFQAVSSPVDSLLNLINKASEDEKVLLYGEISSYFWGYKPDSSLFYAELAINAAQSSRSKYILGKAYNILGNAYLETRQPQKAIENYEISRKYRQDVGNMLEVSHSYNNIALAYRELRLYSEAINAYKIGASICSDIQDYINEAYFILGVAEVYEMINDNNSALDYAIKAVNIFIHKSYPSGMAYAYSIIGSLHKNLNNIPLALEYHKRAHDIYLEQNDISNLSTSNNNLGIVYDEMGDAQKALLYFNESYKISLNNNNKNGVSTALNNIGFVHSKLKDFPKALAAYQASLEISREMNDIPSEMNTLNNIAWVYYHSNEFNKVEEHVNQALALAPQNHKLDFTAESHEILSKLRYDQKRYKEAFDHKALFMALKDSLFNKDRNEKFMEMQVRFETERKENEIEMLKKNDEIKNLTITRQRNVIIFWFTGSLLLVILAGLVYKNLQSKKKINEILSLKNKELKEANNKLIESERHLRDLNATKDRFFSIIAHDLKNPFGALLGFSELLNQNYESNSKQETKEIIALIYESAQKLYKLLDNLLQWSRSQIGNIVYKPELFPLLPVVQQEIELLDNMVSKKNIKITQRVGDHIMVFADPNIISIIIRNLISNAIKFSNDKGKILINAEEKDGMVEVAISDFGIGIEDDDIKKLFRLDESFSTKGTADEEGTGLGLLLCKEFIVKNKGKIWVTSEKGKGSTFYFTLHSHRWS